LILQGHLGYRGTSLIRTRPPLGPYSRPMPRGLWWSWGGVRFLMSEVPLYRNPSLKNPYRILGLCVLDYVPFCTRGLKTSKAVREGVPSSNRGMKCLSSIDRTQRRRREDEKRLKMIALRTRHTMEPLAWHWSHWLESRSNATRSSSVRLQGYLARKKPQPPLGPWA